MLPTAPIRILLVDDHAVVRSGLAVFLMVYEELQFVGEASNGLEAIQKCADLQPDIVLMDMIMPEMDGVQATAIIRERWPHIQVVMLTNFKDDEMVHSAMRAGAIGYLIKNASAADLALAIHQAAMGLPTLGPEAAAVLIRGNQPANPPSHYELTSREKEVLQLMADGLNNLEIASRLIVSRSTVKFHVSSVLTKLGATTRTEAVAIALQKRLIGPGKTGQFLP